MIKMEAGSKWQSFIAAVKIVPFLVLAISGLFFVGDGSPYYVGCTLSGAAEKPLHTDATGALARSSDIVLPKEGVHEAAMDLLLIFLCFLDAAAVA